MIGELPTSITLGDVDYPISTDYRVALTIFDALGDPDLQDKEKAYIMLECLFDDYTAIPREYLAEACEKAALFLDGGVKQKNTNDKPIISWTQDEQLIFAAVNKVAGREVRAEQYMHWWTFLSLFQEIDDKSLLSTVIQLRQKKNKGKKLEKWETEFYKAHKDMIDLKRRYSKAELAEREAINRLLNGG